MGSHYAQMLGHHCSSICWYLASLLNDWNEVKGQFPLVYEDVFSETSSFDLTIHPVIKIKLDLYYVAGIRRSYCSHAQWSDSSVEAHGRMLQPCSRFMGKNPVLWIFLLRLSCSHMPVLVHNHCTTVATVLYPFGGIPCIVVRCNRFFVRTFEQHLCVLGPCRRALDMHLRMLGLARRGAGSIYLPRIVVVVSHHGITGPCIIALGKHRKMLETTHNGLGQRSGCVFLRHYFLFGSSYGFSSSETDYLARRQGYVVPSASLPPYLNK